MIKEKLGQKKTKRLEQKIQNLSSIDEYKCRATSANALIKVSEYDRNSFYET